MNGLFEQKLKQGHNNQPECTNIDSMSPPGNQLPTFYQKQYMRLKRSASHPKANLLLNKQGKNINSAKRHTTPQSMKRPATSTESPPAIDSGQVNQPTITHQHKAAKQTSTSSIKSAVNQKHRNANGTRRTVVKSDTHYT